MKKYLAYGSNMNKKDMERRAPSARLLGVSFLKGFDLVFKGSDYNSYATIENSSSGAVPVAVWQIDDVVERNLDMYEGYPNLYTKETVKTEVNNEEIEALVYVMRPEYDEYFIPKEEYYKCVSEAYLQLGLPLSYLENQYKETEHMMLEQQKMIGEENIEQG